MVDINQAKAIWDAGAGERKTMAEMKKFYDGNNALTGLSVFRKDGAARSSIIVNWYAYVTGTHVGFLTSERSEISIDDKADSQALDNFKKLQFDQNLDGANIEHLTNAIVYGRGVEVHSFNRDNGGIQITPTNAADWALSRDENGALVIAVYQTIIPEASFFDGKFLDADKTVFYVYDKESITTFEETEKGGLSQISNKPHEYGRPPVVEFNVKADRSTHFGPSFRDNANAYCVTRSLLTDEIKLNIDALLATTGMDYKLFFEKDKDGKSALQLMKETGIFTMPDGAEASWLTRTSDIAKFQEDLKLARFAVHQQGYVPDIAQSLSQGAAVSQISGVALKLLYQPMLQKSHEFTTNYKQGLRERIELVNIVNGILGKPILEDYKIKINRALPQNSVEWAQFLPALLAAGGISQRAAIEQLDFIDDVDKVLEEIEGETQDQPTNGG